MRANLVSIISRSITAKILTIALFSLIVPLILYSKFHAADSDRRDFLIHSLQSQGRLVAENLSPRLSKLSGTGLLDVGPIVASVAGEGLHVKVLLRPHGQQDSFLLMATTPPLSPEQQQTEPSLLSTTGILSHLDESCADARPLAVSYMGAEGDDEFLTSITSLHNPAGCWVIITAYSGTFSLSRPFWAEPEVKLAAALYTMIVILMALAMVGAYLDLRAFTRLASRIRQRQGKLKSFATIAQVPELIPVAREFDRMVSTLDASAQALRDAAADNAHSLKTPIATITLALEPLRSQNNAQALSIIERSLERLAALVEAARHLDESTAELLQSGLNRIDLTSLVQTMAKVYEETHAPRVHFSAPFKGTAWIAGTTDSIETMLENLLDNATDFSPDGSTVLIQITKSATSVVLSVVDQGPGVAPERLKQIFKRDFTSRPPSHTSPHYGIGLAIVRRTAEILGGSAIATNRPEGGLCITVTLPLAV